MKTILATIFFSLFFIACSTKPVEEPKEAKKQLTAKNSVFDYMNGFYDDDLDLALDVFKKACEKSSKKPIFENVCINANYYENGKSFFMHNFTPKVLVSNSGDLGLVTGYYEPLLHGSKVKSEKYKYPIYKLPKDLVTIRNKDKYPQFKKFRYKAKIVNDYYVPYDTREEIEKRDDLEAIVYVDNEIDLFFLHIQGSGRVQLEDGEILNIGYAGQNGRKYFAIGKKLVEDGHISKENISLQTIKAYFEQNPHKTKEILNLNPSYIFFTQKEKTATGALGVELVEKRNIAVDRNYIPLGMPVFVETKNPITKEPINKLVIAADVGGAIKGEIRIDYFFGYGKKAENLAGVMKEKGRLFLFIPNI